MARPNILYICSDQHSYRFTGYGGHPLVQTPNLDRLAARGAVFRNAYCGSPVCVPGRACLMTGTFASDNNSFCNSTVWDGTHPTWGTLLRGASLQTFAVGKLDLNGDCDLGFEDLGISNSHWKNADICSLFRRPLLGYRESSGRLLSQRLREERHTDAEVARTAAEFITGRSVELQDSWALWVGFHQPHPPFSCLRRYFDLYPLERIDLPEETAEDIENSHLVYQMKRAIPAHLAPPEEELLRRIRAAYFAMITELDEYVGQLLAALQASGQAENTLVIYTSDHGEQLGEHGQWGKNTLYEDSAHVPLLLAGAGVPGSLQIDAPVGHVDLVPTMLETAGGSGASSLRGHSLWPLLNGQADGHPGFAYVENHSGENCTGAYAIREKEWKYMHFTWFDDALYNLAEDPGERRNLIDEPGARGQADRMRARLESLVDPEEVTRRAFEVQKRFLDRFVAARTEDELAAAFSRMGPAYARALAVKCKTGSLG